MDGVLVDSMPLHTQAWEAYLSRQGLDPTTVARARHGSRNDHIVQELFGSGLSPGEVHEHGEAKERIFRELMAPLLEEFLVPGLREFLAVLDGVPCAVASNAEAANLDFVLDNARLRAHFPVVVDGHMVTHPKPHPEIYLLAAVRLGVEPSRCIVIEDSLTGVRAGLAAGMAVAGIETTLSPVPETGVSVKDFRDPRLCGWIRQVAASW
jgi:HAD superfamily hydrolase (TIGR01509 family)